MVNILFALETEPLKAPTIFHIGNFGISNAMFFASVTAIFTVLLLLMAAKYTQLRPKSHLAYIFELLVDFIWGAAIGTFGDRKTALKHLPLLATLFTFILIGNLTGSGLLPGVGTITIHSGGETNPLLRPFTTDLNATLAMAILTIGLVQFYALRQLGLKKHVRHYFASPLWHPMNLFIGLNEVFGELLKIVTLAMRLFGVIYAGEVLIAAMNQIGGNFGWAAMVPTVLMEIFYSIIQAYVFMMLSATYLSVALADEHAEHAEEVKS
ncbi:MAG TPA: FoF1 ATP synthase subunit a [Candidatus Saccharimonadales bacterium]|nr:FoF1 ATP synthase subunit a [Candidatus Saccharimonadales bacterium]